MTRSARTWKRSSLVIASRWILRDGTNPRLQRLDHRRTEGQTVIELLKRVAAGTTDQEAAISAIALVELVHGIWRADTLQRRARREAFILELLNDVPVYPFTPDIAFLAGRIDGEQQRQEVRIPFQDLLIGATAMHFGYAVVTGNPRHFEMIPGLAVHRL